MALLAMPYWPRLWANACFAPGVQHGRPGRGRVAEPAFAPQRRLANHAHCICWLLGQVAKRRRCLTGCHFDTSPSVGSVCHQVRFRPPTQHLQVVCLHVLQGRLVKSWPLYSTISARKNPNSWRVQISRISTTWLSRLKGAFFGPLDGVVEGVGLDDPVSGNGRGCVKGAVGDGRRGRGGKVDACALGRFGEAVARDQDSGNGHGAGEGVDLAPVKTEEGGRGGGD